MEKKFRQLGSLITLFFLAPQSLVADTPLWIEIDQKSDSGVCIFQEFVLEEIPDSAEIFGQVDSAIAKIFINNTELAQHQPFQKPFQVDCRSLLKVGNNVVGVCAKAVDGPSACFCRLDMKSAGQLKSILTDQNWKVAASNQLDWPALDSNRPWTRATTLGTVANFPWGDHVDSLTVSPLEDYTQWKRAQNIDSATQTAMFDFPEGFDLQLLRTANPGEDSWIGIAFDPQGRLIIAKEKKGLLRLTLSANDSEIKTEVINESLRECRGLLFAGEDLFAMANNDKALFRLRDVDGNGTYEEVLKLAEIRGDVGHGRNEMALDSDGKILAIFGDAVFEPENVSQLPPAMTFPTKIDQARSGFLASFDPSENTWEVLVRGLRNPYGVAVNKRGDVFTYDADAEYDMGAPWYRPTRIDHLIPGADFGWRRVTGQWPPYNPDRPDIPQPTLDIGKGSPTSVTFGYGSHFPAQYDQALYAVDWAYGRIVAVHLSPWGASYAAKAETFLRGRPANITDLEIGPDGAMYFVTGGRGTQSAIYRLSYVGTHPQSPPKSKQQVNREKHADSSRNIRQRLEQLRGTNPSKTIETAWPFLNSHDPWIRHAARVAIESQPVDLWANRSLNEQNVNRRVESLLALVRQGTIEQYPSIINSLNQLALNELTAGRLQAVIFIYNRCLDDVPSTQHQEIVGKLNSLYPHSRFEVNKPLSLLLQKLNANNFVARTIPMLEKATGQQQRMHYLLVLRNVDQGWNEHFRKTYFQHLSLARENIGGDGMPKFVRLIEDESLAMIPKQEREQYQTILAQNSLEQLLEATPDSPRDFVKEWKREDLAKEAGGRVPDIVHGEKMFAAARCIVCHRHSGQGGSIGPDLSSIASRFSHTDILTSILEPSKVVAEKYRSHQFRLVDGRVMTGQVLPQIDYRSPNLRVAIDPLDPRKIVEIEKQSIEQSQLSKTSPMPKGLLNFFTREEILDLLAYLRK